MPIDFQKMVALLQSYKAKPQQKRGRPTIYDIDRTKVDEVINDTKSDHDLRSATNRRGEKRITNG